MDVAYRTDIGRQRDNNEDYVQIYRNQQKVTFAVVADGMGGHLGGDIASDMVVTHFGEAFEKTDSADIHTIAHWAKQLLTLENKRVIQASQKKVELSNMGTTLVGAFVFPTKLLVVNVGDSRCYLYRHSQLRQLSFDHSLVNELLISGAITAQEAKHHPNKNIITQSLGVSEGVSPTFGFFDLQTQDQILLCSDGLTNMVDDDQIAQVLAESQTSEQKCDQLITAANAAGGQDNITVLLIDLQADREDSAHD
ncbi:Stp1/IreP family PP2C-type Ser/Thr phosphatase [Bombilactobacillus mellifer]|uniref:Stp1/IreP family PP2C-type Ser/Thr phosphatase n=1 Tax=Bombilactobacillus mellifer TaxID=1218492 RepID=UPI0023F19CD7|nr:Stp1/IreP family PP2C-type Ser/Thr phosphatase [Bombilactobacillus mellifer]MCT6826061.1 Stp1/IreP family PP2C-type Ser/Thr phosphatase [Bombilactobacillus mellifer]MCT6843975.1 Stp1/IreP family PP2C-type Ser/Thr phosphatase [Bombilactobacillus mellifer]